MSSGIVFAQDRAEYISGEVIVKLKPGAEINQVLSKQTIAQADMQVKKHLIHLDAWIISFSVKSGLDTKGGLSLLKQIPETRFAQLNHKVELRNKNATD